MKPKYRRIAKFLPAIISLSMAATTYAAVIAVGPNGSEVVNGSANGPNSIDADGGDGSNLTPTVIFQSGVDLTGDGVPPGTLSISGPNPYLIDIASGASLTATTSGDGINILAGTSTGTVINNSGIVGSTFGDGIDFEGDGGVVNNLAGGMITGGNGATDHGIEAGDDLTVVNDGIINTAVGGDDGINAGNDAIITNNVGASISGDTDDGVDIDLRGIVNNNGTISGGDDGVFIGSGDVVNRSVVNNNTNFDPMFPFGPISGGSITGGDTGILGGDFLTVNNRNLATITGNGDDGINANDFAIINNFSGGTITGALSGIQVDDDLILVNEFGATIEGLATNGVWAPGGDRADITNDGLIRGGNYGILVDDDLILDNGFFGTITGTNEDGVQADDRADITNNGIITGLDDGIFVDDDATIVNNADGVITGTNDIGVRVGDNSTVTNFGIIRGVIGVDAVSGTPFTLTNSGIIESTVLGGVAIDGGSGPGGADTLNLNFGSQVIGDVELADGFDVINFDGGLGSPFDAASGPFSNSILGDVSGVQEINKTGMGVAFIGVPGNGGFTVLADVITITGGGLYINADIDSAIVPQTTINAGGTALGGTGTWDADIFVTAGGFSAGAIPINLDLDPTNAVGDLAVTGNVTHSPGTFIRHDVTPNGADDLITHTGGTYDLGADTGIRVSATNNDTVIRNGVYTVVDSDIPIAGSLPSMAVQFNDNVNTNDSGLVGSRTWNTGVADTDAVLNSFMYSNFDDGGTNLVFIVDHDFEGLPGLSSNASSLGAALDDSIDNPNAQIQDFIAALDYSDLETVQETMESVIPDNVLGAATGLVGSNYRLHRIVEDHLAMTRSGGTTIIETPATTDAKGGMIPAQVTSSGGGMGNVWGTFSYDWRDSDFGTTDIEGEDASFTVGIDYRVAPNLLLGILFDGTQSDYDYSGGSTDTDSYRFAAYGTYGESTGLYADFLVGYGDHDLDNSRSLGGILAGTSYDTSTDAESLQALLNVGYAMQSGCVKHGPFVGLEYTNIDVDSFAPSGLGGFGSVDGFEVDSLRLLVGYRAEATYGSFTPFGQVAYAHEFEDGPVSATATIPGGATFKFNGGGVESAVLVTLGTGYSITENLSATIAYHSEFSTGDGIDSQGGSIGLNYGF